jgi:hypothetical protein
MAYEIGKKAGCGNDTLLRMLSYIFSKRNGKYFHNTLMASRISNLIFKDYRKYNSDSFSSLSLNDDKNFDSLPFKKSVMMMNGDRLNIKTNSPVLIGWYQEFFEETPLPDTTLYTLNAIWKQNQHATKELESGSPAEMIVYLKVKKNSSYMMLEIPIPSGCTYASKNIYSTYALHTECFKDRVVIYYNSLPRGNYEIKIPLQVRFPGKCTLNPLHIQNMYFKNISGNTSVRNISLN